MWIRNIPGLHPMLGKGAPFHLNFFYQSLIKILIYTHNVREISKINHKSRCFCCSSCDSHRGSNVWLIVLWLTTLVQPRAHPSSAVGSTSDSVLSGLVSINLLLSAVGRDNPAEEWKVLGHQHWALSHRSTKLSFLMMVPAAALFVKTWRKLSLILIFLTRYLLQLYVLSFAYCQKQENKSLWAEPRMTSIQKLITLVKMVQMICKWQREHCGHSALYSSNCVCVALNLKVSNMQVYLSLQPKFYQTDARFVFLHLVSINNT